MYNRNRNPIQEQNKNQNKIFISVVSSTPLNQPVANRRVFTRNSFQSQNSIIFPFKCLLFYQNCECVRVCIGSPLSLDSNKIPIFWRFQEKKRMIIVFFRRWASGCVCACVHSIKIVFRFCYCCPEFASSLSETNNSCFKRDEQQIDWSPADFIFDLPTIF